jgi:hypothetical protein
MRFLMGRAAGRALCLPSSVGRLGRACPPHGTARTSGTESVVGNDGLRWQPDCPSSMKDLARRVRGVPGLLARALAKIVPPLPDPPATPLR